MASRIPLSLFLLLMSLAGLAQFDRLKNYNVKDGLSSCDAYETMQDREGYIWSIGDMGVSRFDGYEFKNFTTEDGLADNTNFTISQDDKGRIWFAAISGRLSYYRNDRFLTLPCNDSLQKLIGYKHISSLYTDSQDTIWLGVDAHYFIKIHPGWQPSDLHKVAVPDGRYFVQLDPSHLIYGGLNRPDISITGYDRQLKKLVAVTPDYGEAPLWDHRFVLTQLKDGSYLASVERNLFRFSNSGILSFKLEKSTILSLVEGKNKSLIVGSAGGAYIYAGYDLKKPALDSVLANKVVPGICVDQENGIWFATEGEGLFYTPNRNFNYYTQRSGISESEILSMGIYRNEVIIGHLDSDAEMLSTTGAKKILVPDWLKSSRFQNKLMNFYTLHGKTYFMYQRVAGYVDEKGFQILPKLRSKTVKKMTGSADGKIWALHYSCVMKYDPEKKFAQVDSCQLGKYTDNLFEDMDGVLWICSIDGMYTYQDHRFLYLGNQDPLYKQRPSCVVQKRDKSIWIATRGGGILVKKNDRLEQITIRQGLASNMCKALCIDSNIIWVGTNKGLSKITISRSGAYHIENFSEKNGLLSNEVNLILKHKGRLWLAHNNGVSAFDPLHMDPNTCPPPVYIAETYINDSLFKAEDLKQLSYDQNNININYTGLSYKDAERLEYRYKLEGLDNSWSYTRNTGVSYHVIPPGSYRFLVAAKNNDGYWSSLPAMIGFRIAPPWWQTWPFISATILAGLLSLFIVFRQRLSVLKKRERLKALQQTELANAELKALRAQMNPHFVFNAINSVQSFITGNDPVSSQRYLSKFARLIRYVVDNSKPASILLSKELEALNLYLDLETLRFENKFDHQIVVSDQIDAENTYIPSMLIQPFVENAIWHGLMLKPSKGKITIHITCSEQTLICIIEDNGIGRKKAQQIMNAKHQGAHKSFGLSITQERLDIINRQNNSRLTLEIIDLEDENGIATGTRVELKLPFS